MRLPRRFVWLAKPQTCWGKPRFLQPALVQLLRPNTSGGALVEHRPHAGLGSRGTRVWGYRVARGAVEARADVWRAMWMRAAVRHTNLGATWQGIAAALVSTARHPVRAQRSAPTGGRAPGCVCDVRCVTASDRS